MSGAPEALKALGLDGGRETAVSRLLGVDLVRQLHFRPQHNAADDRAVLDIGNQHLRVPRADVEGGPANDRREAMEVQVVAHSCGKGYGTSENGPDALWAGLAHADRSCSAQEARRARRDGGPTLSLRVVRRLGLTDVTSTFL